MPIPISPTPSTSFAVSGGVSGIVGSGTNNNFIDPSSTDWFVETQTLDFEYYRIPTWASVAHLSPADMSLSSFGVSNGYGTAIVSGNIAQTNLLVKVTAEYKVEKQRNIGYGASSYVVPQKFTVYPQSSDHITSYGTVSGNIFGPRGIVRTTQKYENRRPWETSDTSAHEYVMDAWNLDYDNPGSSGVSIDAITTDYRQTYAIWPVGLMDGVNGIHKQWNYLTMTLGAKSGPYSTSQDATADIYQVLDWIGMYLKSGSNFRDNRNNHVGHLPSYDYQRHDYT